MALVGPVRRPLALVVGPILAIMAVVLAGCGATSASSSTSGSSGATGGLGKVLAVGAESQYANVIAQLGGRYVSVSAIINNPNTDPHEFEASASVAERISGARLIVQNGAGYDSFMGKIEQAAHSSARKVVVVQQLLGLPAGLPNPHLWYKPGTMRAVAAAVTSDLSGLAPEHRAYFEANKERFDQSLTAWDNELAAFRSAHRGVPVAVTEPVADYMLQAVGARVLTPTSLQQAIMNGTDPSPQDISRQEQLLSSGKVKAFLYNEQVTDSLTQTFLGLAKKHHVPVVAVYETMPIPGYDYQTWMEAELRALSRAITVGASTVRL